MSINSSILKHFIRHVGEKVAGTHITITIEGDRERFCDEANEGFLITADCQETVMSVEAWTMVAR